MKKRWVQRPFDEAMAMRLRQEQGLEPFMAHILAARGITDAALVRRFLEPALKDLPDPFALKDMELATERLVQAIETHETIGIFGDYDVDGISSTTALWDFLHALSAQVVATIPDRIKEGYGLSLPGLQRLKDAGARLVVTVDCGISAHAQVDAANAMGMDVIIVDHHTVPEILPRAYALINPHRPDCPSKRVHLCAAGVVFNLCMALRIRLRERGFFAGRQEPNLRHLLDVVGMATVADVVPLVGENRIFVRQALQLIAAQTRLGLSKLLDVAEIKPHQIKASTLGFQLGPRMNAAGRLDDAMIAVQLLRSFKDEEALRLAYVLDDKNTERREHEKEAVEKATCEIEKSAYMQDAKVLVLADEGWHPGVVGIIASRLVDRFAKPALVIGRGGKGSGRSIPAFHLHDALSRLSEYVIGFGGHAHAVGVHLDMARVDHFREALSVYADAALSEDDLVKTHYYDFRTDLSVATCEHVKMLESLEPFGRANPEPVLYLSGMQMTGLKPLSNNHIKGIVKDAHRHVPFIAFGMADSLLKHKGPCDMLATLGVNEWQGQKSLQLQVKDFA